MTAPETVKQTLGSILVPGVKRSLENMNIIKDISIIDETAKISLYNAALMKDTREWLDSKIKEAVTKPGGIKEVSVIYEDIKPKELNKIKNVIAVMSGEAA